MTDKNLCPRLLDYLIIAGCRAPNGSSHVSQTPELLRRYPLEDHQDFPLPNDVIFFCQPEGCISVSPKCMSLRENTSFIFTLTEKDTGRVRYGICINFFRPFEKRVHPSEAWQKMDKSCTGSNSFDSLEGDRGRSPNRTPRKTRVRNNTLTSLCVISHHPFFSTFRESLLVLRRLIEACHDRSCVRKVGGSKVTARDSVWGVLTGLIRDNISSLIMHEVREIETWILRLLSAPVPVPGKTRVEVHVLPKELESPLVFALPDSTRFSLVDFPVHMPLELLGVDACLKVLTAIMLEHKVILQSRDYNALSMSVLAFVAMLYPLEYMFPIIPLLPTCMASAEQLLLAPTPYLIGVPASFFGYKKDFPLPDDVWLIDLDTSKITTPTAAETLPSLPEPEGTVLKTHLKQALASNSMTPQPFTNLDALAPHSELWQRKDSIVPVIGFSPLICGNDVDSVDIASRVAMVRFFNSPNVLGNFVEHTRTIRLYPRPVVAFQLDSFLNSRAEKTPFAAKLARTQAVEYLSEWALCPTNVVYQRVQTGIYDPSLIGDKPKWFAHQLQPLDFHVYDNSSSLGAAITSVSNEHSDDNPTDESGSDSDAGSNSSSYSSLSDFVSDLFNSNIRGETPAFLPEMQILAVDEAQVYSPPRKLLLPESSIANSDSALSLQEDSDMSSSASSSPLHTNDVDNGQETVFRYDSGNVIKVTQSNAVTHASRLRSSSPGSVQSSPRRSNVTATPANSPSTPSVQPAPPLAKPKSLLLRERSHSASSASRKNNKDACASEAGCTKIFTISSDLSASVPKLPGSNVSQAVPSPAKPFSPLGNRKILVEKSNLVKRQSPTRKQKESQKAGSVEPKLNKTSISNSENQQFLLDVVNNVLEGKGVGLMKINRINKLMEDESYRNLVVSRLNRNLDKKVPEDVAHIEDVCVSKPVLKGMQSLIKAVVRGLGQTLNNHGLGGMASAYMALEIAHTHYWSKDSCNKSDESLTPEKVSLHGSSDSLEPPGTRKVNAVSKFAGWGLTKQGSESQPTSAVTSPRTPHLTAISGIMAVGSPTSFNSSDSFMLSPHRDIGSPAIINGHENESTEITSASDDGSSSSSGKPSKWHSGKTSQSGSSQISDGGEVFVFSVDSHASSVQGEMMREMVRNKEMITAGRMDRKFDSEGSEISEGSTLVSTKSERENFGKRRHRVDHQSIRSALSDSEMETNWPGSGHGRRRGSTSIWNSKSTFSAGYRYHEGKLIHTGMAGLTVESTKNRTYVFECLVGKDRSHIWDSMQFWEDMFLDAVAQERDMIGMDQKPSEMLERYNSLDDVKKKKLEFAEDKLLSEMLFNQAAFMLMMKVPKAEIKKKIRRLLGKSHIGLQLSQDINNLLDNIQQLYGNDIDLKALSSRRIQRLTFVVHWGKDNTGDMLFMEVCDDCLLLRSVNGAILDRWWYDKLYDMTYHPRTRVLGLWRKNQGKLQLNHFYAKKCRVLYFSLRETMAKTGQLPVTKLGGEFPVQDFRTKETGILKVCMEGIGLLLQENTLFIEVARIRKCFTQKGDIFILEERDHKSQKIIQHKFKSSMANDIARMFQRVISVHLASAVDIIES